MNVLKTGCERYDTDVSALQIRKQALRLKAQVCFEHDRREALNRGVLAQTAEFMHLRTAPVLRRSSITQNQTLAGLNGTSFASDDPVLGRHEDRLRLHRRCTLLQRSEVADGRIFVSDDGNRLNRLRISLGLPPENA